MCKIDIYIFIRCILYKMNFNEYEKLLEKGYSNDISTKNEVIEPKRKKIIDYGDITVIFSKPIGVHIVKSIFKGHEIWISHSKGLYKEYQVNILCPSYESEGCGSCDNDEHMIKEKIIRLFDEACKIRKCHATIKFNPFGICIPEVKTSTKSRKGMIKEHFDSQPKHFPVIVGYKESFLREIKNRSSTLFDECVLFIEPIKLFEFETSNEDKTISLKVKYSTE
jgi:hypothetical protein